jgi:NADPH:quinone reductase-like Zn-dependent oxidoreductase
MRAWQIDGGFGLDNLRLVERPAPRPGPVDVLVRVEAVSLNSRDLQMIEGAYNPRQPLPLVPCSDAVGRIEAVGEAVDEGWLGRRVCTAMVPGWVGGAPRRELIRDTLGGPRDGTLAEYVVLPGSGVVPCPENLTAVEGSTLGVAGLTAWNALVTHAGLTAGGIALALGTGGVSIFALQIAGLLGCRAIVTSSSDEKLRRATELGAWRTINYRETPEWGRQVQALTGGRGADVVVEVGGAATLPESIRAVAIGGTIALIGVVSGRQGPLNVVPIFMRQVRLQGVLVGHRESFEAFARAIEACDLHPVIDRVLPFEEAPQALRHLASGEHFGKVCIAL